MMGDSNLMLKVCGMKHPDNIEGLVKLEPDFMGFIFYPESPRYANEIDAEMMASIPAVIRKTGVFVNAELSDILALVEKYQLDAIQLHGDESLDLVKELKQRGLTVIKVFRVQDKLPEAIIDFDENVDFFLFDTKSKAYGGTGQHFDWSILSAYDYQTPYFLSGGVELKDIETIHALALPKLVGVDVNSKFELEPGLKDLARVQQLKEQL